MPVATTFTARKAAYLSSLTPHMVNYLCRTGVVEPSGRSERGRGTWRAYTFNDVVLLRALKRLLDSGVSVARLKNALDQLRILHPEIVHRSLPRRYLVTDGVRVYLRAKSQILESLDGTGQFAFAFVVELQQIEREVSEALAAGGT